MTHPDTASDLFSTPPAAPANPAWWIADALAATRAAGRDWRGVAPADFGRRTRHVQTAMMLTAADGTVLAPGADELGTLDLFGGDL